MDISVILPVLNEHDNLRLLIPRLYDSLKRESLSYEIIVIDGGSIDGTRQTAEALGARVFAERRKGFAGAMETGFAEARADYVLTLDADLSDDPDFISKMWRARNRADIVVASRYTRGGVTYSSRFRHLASWMLNRALRRILSMPVRDLSSGFRLYHRAALEGLHLTSTNFEVQQEILVRAYAAGFSVTEVPFVYFPRNTGRSHVRMMRFGVDIARSVFSLWKLRNSLDSADYDERGFYSIIPVQRYWHRSRHRIFVTWARGAGRILDAGCGSSLTVQSLNNVVGMDFSFGKLRFLRRYGMPLVQGSAFGLPFRDQSFDCVVSQEVIEHLPFDEVIFAEMRRVLRPSGRLILGTPDYSTWQWHAIEALYGWLMPGGYNHEHVTRYTRDKLTEIVTRHGFVVEQVAYIGGGDMFMRCRKPEPAHPDAIGPASQPPFHTQDRP